MATRKKMTAAAARAEAAAGATAYSAQILAKSTRAGYQVNLSGEEKTLIARAAELSGLELSTFMRSESVKAAHDILRRAGVPA